MKKILYLLTIFIIIFLSFTILTYASEVTDVFVTIGSNNINAQNIEGQLYLFLPSYADLTKLSLNVENSYSYLAEGNNQTVSLSTSELLNVFELSEPDSLGIYSLNITTDNQEYAIKLLKSSNVSSVFINSNDAVNFGKTYIDAQKGNKASGNVDVIDAKGNIIYSGAFKEIKGRGNSTWTGADKKPYQIKLSEKSNLLNDGETTNESKTWVLLANSFDPTLIRNQLTYDLAKEIDMPYSPESTPVDLYYDGVYIGSYLLSEKVEISEGRVDISNLENEIEKVGLPDDITFSKDTNIYGNEFKYAEGVVVPDYASLGFLLEYEYPDRVNEENCWFSTSNGNYIVIKSPENLPKSFVKRLSERYQEFENAVYNGGINPYNSRPYTDFVNIDSLVKMFAIEQFSKDIDAFVSSTYMYLDENMEFNYGPVWDFDISYGIGSNSETDENQKTSGFTVFNTDLSKKLLNIPHFKKLYIDFYNHKLTPLIENVILGHERGLYLKPLENYSSDIVNSQIMNFCVWEYSGFSGNKSDWIFDNYYENLDYLKKFISNRHQWTKIAINNHYIEDIETVNIYTYYDEINNQIYFSLGEKDYYFMKFISVDNNFVKLKHLSGIEYSSDIEVFINNIKAEFEIDDLDCIVVKIPHHHNVMPSKTENVIFKDVNSQSWYYDYVYNVYNKGWMKGVTEKRFQPDEPLKKGMVITALFRLSQADGAANKYAVSSECYNDAASWAVEQGIIFEYEKEFMELNHLITRQEAAILFYKAAGELNVEYALNFSDSHKIDSFAVDAVKWCVKNGIFSGDNKNRLNPDNYLSRAEFTKMLTVYSELNK